MGRANIRLLRRRRGLGIIRRRLRSIPRNLQSWNLVSLLRRKSWILSAMDLKVFPRKTLLTTVKTQGFTDQIEKKQKSLEPWTAKINEKQAAIALTQSELDLIREKESQSLKAVEEVSAKLKSLDTDKFAKESEVKQSQKEIGTIEKQTQDAIAQLKQCQQKSAKIYESLSQSRAKADEAKASLSASQTQGQVLTSLTRLRDSGRIQGFHVLSLFSELN